MLGSGLLGSIPEGRLSGLDSRFRESRDTGYQAGETGEHLSQLVRDRVLLTGEILDLAPRRLRGELRLGTRLAELTARLGTGLADGLLGQRPGLLDYLGGIALGLDAA